MMAISRMKSLFRHSCWLMMKSSFKRRLDMVEESWLIGLVHRYRTVNVKVLLIIHHNHSAYGYGVVVQSFFKQPTEVEVLS